MSYVNINPAEFEAGMKNENSVILDVRTPGEWNEGIIPGSLLINVMEPDFANRIDDLDRSKAYYIYCRSGNRSGMVAGFMSQKGFSELFNLADGIMSWTGEIAEPA